MSVALVDFLKIFKAQDGCGSAARKTAEHTSGNTDSFRGQSQGWGTEQHYPQPALPLMSMGSPLDGQPGWKRRCRNRPGV